MDAVQIAQHLIVEFRQLLVNAGTSVSPALVTLLPVGTVRAILALVVFLRPAELIALDRRRSVKAEPLPVGAHHISLVVNLKITRTIGIVPAFAVLAFLFVHGEFYVFLHTLFLAVQIVVVAAVSRIGNRILGMSPVFFPELLHEQLEAVYI